MESARSRGTLWRSLTKIRRLRQPAAVSTGADDDSIQKPKISKTLGVNSAKFSDPLKDKDQQQSSSSSSSSSSSNTSKNREAMESLIAELFAGVSAIKASYAQLQVAQSPYDPDTVQSADESVVSELKRISELKQCYLNGQIAASSPDSQLVLAAQIHEQRNLLATYKITTRKLESDLQHKDANIHSLKSQLLEAERQNGLLETGLHPGRSLAALDGLRLSGLNPCHFLAAVRFAVQSIRSFVKLLVKGMESAKWDLDAAAGSVHPGVSVRRKPEHRSVAFESYVCQMMFSDFQHRDFSFGSLEELSSWGCQRFFEEFAEVKSLELNRLLKRTGSNWGKFCRVKYLLLVHPRMESAFLGDLEQRAMVSSGVGFPASELFLAFAEMARRVWLLHCLFFSFPPGDEAAIFQARRGSRFSEVYMESVSAGEVDDVAVAPALNGEKPSTVGFTVVPGFRVGGTVIQCKVYLSSIGRS